ncbi:hypothetical protein Acj133p014 [Acinetobacter phage 133]|uniref:Uncharacterized protein n=1 Tax=Acinetobacter phage 133 TaxID=2919552 RepID=D9I5Y0_9CAUD|nr:hypothetical protein Acj133p014 [Acinetobacter phage 133]ADJ19361.1 hypothetical protein Acj133p014 [Acinetobacter phage 133]
MYYVSLKSANDFLQFAKDALAGPDGTHKGNSNITIHAEARWIVNKLKTTIKLVEAAQQVTEEPIKVPVTDGVFKCISCIQEIRNETN